VPISTFSYLDRATLKLIVFYSSLAQLPYFFSVVKHIAVRDNFSRRSGAKSLQLIAHSELAPSAAVVNICARASAPFTLLSHYFLDRHAFEDCFSSTFLCPYTPVCSARCLLFAAPVMLYLLLAGCYSLDSSLDSVTTCGSVSLCVTHTHYFLWVTLQIYLLYT